MAARRVASKNRLAALSPQQRSPYRTRRVAAVNSDGTVDLDWGVDEDGQPVTVNVKCDLLVRDVIEVGHTVRLLVEDNTDWAVVAIL